MIAKSITETHIIEQVRHLVVSSVPQVEEATTNKERYREKRDGKMGTEIVEGLEDNRPQG